MLCSSLLTGASYAAVCARIVNVTGSVNGSGQYFFLPMMGEHMCSVPTGWLDPMVVILNPINFKDLQFSF